MSFDLVVGDDEVDNIVLGIFGDDRSAFDSAREFGPVHRDDALEVTGDDAPIIGGTTPSMSRVRM